MDNGCDISGIEGLVMFGLSELPAGLFCSVGLFSPEPSEDVDDPPEVQPFLDQLFTNGMFDPM